jgi:hypothetical protein
MNNDHLSAWEQEEYILEQRTPRVLRHLTECVRCREEVEELERGLAGFRTVATQWSSQALAHRPQRPLVVPQRRLVEYRWAFAALVPILLVILLLVPFHATTPARPVAHLSDDALMDQVDEQVSVAVPSSMESLTHLVTAGNGSGNKTADPRGEQLVQTN